MALPGGFAQNASMHATLRGASVKLLSTSLAGLLIGLDCGAASEAAPKTIEIAVFQNVALGDSAQAVLQRAYDKLGITLKATPMPLRRALQMANAGKVDGDLMRTQATLQEEDQLIRVRVPVVHLVMAVYKRGRCPARVGADELRGQRVAYVRGTRVLEQLIPSNAQFGTVSARDSIRHLQRGIAEYMVSEELEADAVLTGKGFDNICKVPEPLLVTELFHSLHKRHAELALRLERVLKDMSDSGETAQIWAAEARKVRAAALLAH